ncbi:hypothetical protein [Prosthecomicrobium sp. N25]|uniref:hypothetical protein n=1 Tax=Prosthecomicrobium sp. N25 TaxID=3129254 RepID=UPI003078538E
MRNTYAQNLVNEEKALFLHRTVVSNAIVPLNAPILRKEGAADGREAGARTSPHAGFSHGPVMINRPESGEMTSGLLVLEGWHGLAGIARSTEFGGMP